MRTRTLTVSIIFTALTHLTPCLATWSFEKGAEINFYTGTQCTRYNGEADAWWNHRPFIADLASTTGADPECFTLNMPGNSQSINTAHVWESTIFAGETPGPSFGHCQFWDGFTCSGNTATSSFVPSPPSGECLPARSPAGFLWKSAKCYRG
ncbi:hypothetical protein B0H14DRAFT_3535441 [Mycena olivaceomarginata]|nr:hypothetical protein B0H14DRAFT_3535441 [Mycena olivaceomarginata]